jgi:antibiotic biosynthesis monooxygenase (ABM) superfamily enzyme
MAIIFIGLWVGLTLPILLSVVFTLLKPIVTADVTGISMIIIVLIIGILDAYIGVKIFEKKIQPWLEKKKKRKFP